MPLLTPTTVLAHVVVLGSKPHNSLSTCGGPGILTPTAVLAHVVVLDLNTCGGPGSEPHNSLSTCGGPGY